MRAVSTRTRTLVAVAAFAAAAAGVMPRAEARDFINSLWDTLSGRPAPPRPAAQASQSLGFSASGVDGQQFPPQAPQPTYGGRSTAYCVRTCDGRYFPLSATNEQSRAAACASLCPASETKVFYGSSIDYARGDNGKPYSSLPNAFKYREQLVSGCTCNGKDSVGLAKINIDDDKTIRKGDIVAGENGLIVASRVAERRRGQVADFSPAPRSIRARFERSHAMARD